MAPRRDLCVTQLQPPSILSSSLSPLYFPAGLCPSGLPGWATRRLESTAVPPPPGAGSCHHPGRRACALAWALDCSPSSTPSGGPSGEAMHQDSHEGVPRSRAAYCSHGRPTSPKAVLIPTFPRHTRPGCGPDHRLPHGRGDPVTRRACGGSTWPTLGVPRGRAALRPFLATSPGTPRPMPSSGPRFSPLHEPPICLETPNPRQRAAPVGFPRPPAGGWGHTASAGCTIFQKLSD